MENNIKTLYTFSIDIEKEVEKSETVTVDGQTYDRKVKIKEKTPLRFALKKPSRNELEDARLFYGIEYNKAITDGFLTKGMMVNKYANTTGGIFSQNEAKELLHLLKHREALDLELKQASSVNASKETLDEITAKVLSISRQILEIELSNQSLFQHTAENKAKEKTITYMFYALSFVERGDKWAPLFEGDDESVGRRFALRQAKHFDLEDKEDPVLLQVRDRFLNLFAHYYEGLASTEEDFKRVEDELLSRIAGTLQLSAVEEQAVEQKTA